MIFLSVGTQFPFDRLVKAIDNTVENGLVDEKIFAQISKSLYKPRNFEYAEFLEKKLFDSYLTRASSVVSHAGMGIITLALDNNKPLLVMPRLKKHGEVVNDHQVAIARKFGELGHILVAYEAEELPEKIKQLRTFISRKRKTQPQAVTERIAHFLNELSVISK